MFQVWGLAVDTLCAPSTTVPPPVQVTVTLTEAPLAGDQILFTVKVASLRVFVIVQLPGAVPLQVPAGEPLAVYPAGMVSVAVQVGVVE
jgi:hypothetical protein